MPPMMMLRVLGVVSIIISQTSLSYSCFAFTSPTQQHTATSLAGGRPLIHKSKTTQNGLKKYHSPCSRSHRSLHRNSRSSLNLIPLSDAWSTTSPFSALLPELGCGSLFNSEGMLIHQSADADDDENKRYRLYIATEADDLPPVAQLTIDVFDATVISLASVSEWSALERAVVEPMAGMYNAYAGAVAYTEVLSGLRRRVRNRLTDANGGDDDGIGGGAKDVAYDWLAPLVVPENASSGEERTSVSSEDVAARSSIVLVLARPVGEGGRETEAVASVEVRLQPTDAKIPFSQPWLDELERKLARSMMPSPAVATNGALASGANDVDADSTNPPLRPYLCNLAVSPSLRSLGVGRALCRVVEAVARDRWGYDHLYLHVDPENDAARGLYEKEGYVDVGRRWNYFWTGGASDISYYVKRLGKDEV